MKKKKLLLHLSDQYDQLHADVELLKETVQKLIDGKSRYIPNETPLKEQEKWEATIYKSLEGKTLYKKVKQEAKDSSIIFDTKERWDKMQQTANHDISLDSFKSLDASKYLMHSNFAEQLVAKNRSDRMQEEKIKGGVINARKQENEK